MNNNAYFIHFPSKCLNAVAHFIFERHNQHTNVMEVPLLLTFVHCRNLDVSDLSELAAPLPSSPASNPSQPLNPRSPGMLSELDIRYVFRTPGG